MSRGVLKDELLYGGLPSSGVGCRLVDKRASAESRWMGGWGPVVPADGEITGMCLGALFMQTPPGVLYRNEGSETYAQFRLMPYGTGSNECESLWWYHPEAGNKYEYAIRFQVSRALFIRTAWVVITHGAGSSISWGYPVYGNIEASSDYGVTWASVLQVRPRVETGLSSGNATVQAVVSAPLLSAGMLIRGYPTFGAETASVAPVPITVGVELVRL